MSLPILPEELVQHIISFLPTSPKEKHSLVALSSTSRTFHRIVQSSLYGSVFFRASSESQSTPVDLFVTTVKSNPTLGAEVKKIELDTIFRGRTAGRDLVMSLVQATKESLEELILDGVELSHLADILAVPVHLKRLTLETCHVKAPATSHAIPPPNSVQTLRVAELFPDSLAMPYKSFPKLVNFELYENETCESSEEFTPIANFIYNLQFQLVNFSVEIWELPWHWSEYPFSFDWSHLFGEIMTELRCSDSDLAEVVKSFKEDEDIEERYDRGLGAIIASSKKLHTLVMGACVLKDQDEWAMALATWMKMRSSEGLFLPGLKKIIVDLQLECDPALEEYLADYCVGFSELKDVCQRRGINLLVREEC